jgi:hypothetical protein
LLSLFAMSMAVIPLSNSRIAPSGNVIFILIIVAKLIISF